MQSIQSVGRRRALLGLLLLLVLVLATVAAPAAASAAGPRQRHVHDPVTGADLVINDEGSCGRTDVDVNMSAPLVKGEVRQVIYDVDASCNVKVRPGKIIKGKSAAQITGQPARPLGPETTGDLPTLASSQTVQDVINIDIAKFRLYTQFRRSNGLACWEGIRPAIYQSSVSWNHPVSASITGSSGLYSCRSYVWAEGRGHFHTDFLWCNLQSQEFYLYNTNYVFGDGHYTATFRRTVDCSGTHVATSFWVYY